MKRTALAAALAATALTPFALQADERPPSDGTSIAGIVAAVEKEKYGPVVDVSYDDGQWEVEAVKDDRQYELAVDTAGNIQATHEDDRDAQPGKDALSLSQLLDRLTTAKWTPVVEASFEGRSWEIEAYKDGAKHELRVDAKTGEVLRERRDD